MSCAERKRRHSRFPLEIRAARTPDAPALIYQGKASSGPGARVLSAMNFHELNLATASVARELSARGVCSCSRVGLLLSPGPISPVLLLALLRVGAVAVPISTRLPGSAVSELLGRSGCRQVIADRSEPPGSAAGIDVIDTAGLFAVLELDPAHPVAPHLAKGGRGGVGTPLPPFDATADATIIFTSGSTGTPKAALHTFENHWASAVGANRNIPLRPGDRWLLSLPPWHVGGLAIVFRCLQGGAAVVLAGKNEPLADAIPGFGATHISLVATQLYRLLREERGRAALRSLKAVLLGGGPAPATLIGEALAAGARLVTSYGSTEMSSQATATRPDDPPWALRTAGRPLAFRELSVAADGEILVRGRTLFRGYIEEEGVRSARDASGWFPTGDLGHLDADGRLFVTGRRDTMFISGGENIHPEEIEREILRFPGVLETIVVPVPDSEFGARPVAFLRTADGSLPDAAELDHCLRMTLPGFKMPRRLLRWPDVEEEMKPDRRALAALARKTPPIALPGCGPPPPPDD